MAYSLKMKVAWPVKDEFVPSCASTTNVKSSADIEAAYRSPMLASASAFIVPPQTLGVAANDDWNEYVIDATDAPQAVKHVVTYSLG
jgi:hypothetical protein